MPVMMISFSSTKILLHGTSERKYLKKYIKHLSEIAKLKFFFLTEVHFSIGLFVSKFVRFFFKIVTHVEELFVEDFLYAKREMS